jgi:hypothetical protein
MKRSIATILRSVGLRTQPRSHIRIPARPAADPSTCTHLFERISGIGRACRYCLTPAPGSRAQGKGTSMPRLCASEKDVQKACIDLYVLAGCRYSAKHDTDIYVLGTRRPRNLPGIAHRTFQTPGIGDIWAFLPIVPRFAKPGVIAPKAVWHEVKAEDGSPSPAQRRFQKQCLDRGIAHLMGGVDELRSFLNMHGFLQERAHA